MVIVVVRGVVLKIVGSAVGDAVGLAVVIVVVGSSRSIVKLCSTINTLILSKIAGRVIVVAVGSIFLD